MTQVSENKGLLLFLGVLLTGLSQSVGCHDSSNAIAKEPSPVTVELLRLEPELLLETVDLVGQIESEGTVIVKPEIEGVIASIDFTEGHRVEKDQVLYRLRNGEQKALLHEAEAQRALAEATYKRTKKLAKRDVSSAAQLERALAERAVADARVELAKVILDRTEIRAPYSGLVGDSLVFVGASVSEETSLVRLDSIDHVQLFFSVPERAVGLARMGIPIEAKVATYPGETFPGEVFFISPSLDRETRRMLIKAWMPNPGHKLRPGMFAKVKVEIGRKEGALLVPEASVVYSREGQFVWRVGDGNKAERVMVTLGARQAGRVEVVSGLSSGDEIVTAGTNKVEVGRTLLPPESQPAEASVEEAGAREGS